MRETGNQNSVDFTEGGFSARIDETMETKKTIAEMTRTRVRVGINEASRITNKLVETGYLRTNPPNSSAQTVEASFRGIEFCTTCLTL